MSNEFIQIEGFQSNEEKQWLEWINKIEKLVGHSMDGDQVKDGYSLDFAFGYFMAGWTIESYIEFIKRKK
jgi:hypothetical protein